MAAALNGLGLRAVDLGLVWERLSGKYPIVEEHAPVPNPIETFAAATAAPTVSFQVFDAPPAARLWLLSSDQTELAQIQVDRVGFNWRRILGNEVYPRFPRVRESFEEVYTSVLEFAASRRPTEKVLATQCEVSYMNEIPAVGGGGGHGDPDPVLQLWKPVTDVLPGPAEDVRFATRHRLPEDKRTRGGRLLIELLPVNRPVTMEPLYLLSLTVRGEPATSDVAGVRAFLELGHEVIVKTFASITTTTMHEQWGKIL